MTAELVTLGKGYIRQLPLRHNGYKYRVQDESGHYYYVLPQHAGKTLYKIDQAVQINYLSHGSIAFHTIEPLKG
jgi:hypothetical protein